jgi:hypothetical protein
MPRCLPRHSRRILWCLVAASASAANAAGPILAASADHHAAVRAAYVTEVQRRAPAAYRMQSVTVGRIEAHNEAQDLRAGFDVDGLTVVTSAREDRPLQLSLDAFGCDDALDVLPLALPSADGNRASYRRGDVVEWYVNGPLGLEQGFDIATRPACREAGGGSLTVTMRIDGLSVQLEPSGRAATLRDEAGDIVLRYAELFVQDARGRSLPAMLSAGDGWLAIHVDDSDAAYPLVIDPLLSAQPQKLVADDAAADDSFGHSVAIDGDVAVIGAPDDDNAKGVDAGAVYVFTRQPGVDAWVFQQKLLTDDATLTGGDRFGRAVAVSGNRIAIGAPLDNASRGQVQVFERPSAAAPFVFAQKIIPADVANSDRFGSALALSGTTLVGTSPFDDTAAGVDAGSVHVFVKGAAGFALQAKLTAAGAAAADEFGSAVALSGDTLAVGMHGDDDNGAESGSALVFVRSGVTWALQAKLAAPNGKADDRFGAAIALSGNTTVIGAPRAGAANDGRGYVFVRNAGVWQLQQSLQVGSKIGSVAIDEPWCTCARRAAGHSTWCSHRPASRALIDWAPPWRCTPVRC